MENDILLVSGLAGRATSFYRQLELLSRAMQEQGAAVKVIDAVTAASAEPGSFRAAVLLGYPDQFTAFVRRARGLPCFLWAQFSRPPSASMLQGVVPVPLTRATEIFLLESGLKETGPVIPHGVDVDVFTPLAGSEIDGRGRGVRGVRGNGRGREDLVVGTVAANSPRKKLGAVIEAFGLLAEELPDARLVIKTDRVVSHEGFDLAARAARTGVAGRVTLIEDELSDLELARLYRGLSVYVNLSEWEGFCIPVAEAMSCGVPVACQPGQGPGEIVPYRDLLVPGGEQVRDNGSVLVQPDPACAAEVILKAFRCPGLLERLSEQGRQEAVRIYSIREAARSWLSFIDSQGRHI